MNDHRPSNSFKAQVDTFGGATRRTLDAYKHGELTSVGALEQFERHAALLLDSLRSQFVIRLRNLEALRTPRGEVVPAERPANRD